VGEGSELLVTPSSDGERIILELSRPASRLGLSVEEWEALKAAGDDLAALILHKREAEGTRR
jgi:hypothetical protein